jgi:hypothetical protein
MVSINPGIARENDLDLSKTSNWPTNITFYSKFDQAPYNYPTDRDGYIDTQDDGGGAPG